MYPVSDLFKTCIAQPNREFEVKAVVNGVTYTDGEVVQFEIFETLISGEEFTIGTAIPARLDISLRTAKTVPENAQIIPYIRLFTSWKDANVEWDNANTPWNEGATEWLKLGEFYVDSRQYQNDVWKFTCYDKLMASETQYLTALSFPATMDAVMNDICTQLGIVRDSSVVINPAYTIQKYSGEYKIRQMIEFIAAAHVSSARMNKDGLLAFVTFSATPGTTTPITYTDYMKVEQTNPQKVITRIEVSFNNDGDVEVVEAGSGTEDTTLKLDNPYIDQAIANTMLAALNGFAYVPFTMDWRAYPHIEIGDSVSITQIDGLRWVDAEIVWELADIKWENTTTFTSLFLTNKMSFKGGLKATITAPSASQQKSEFPYKGSLTEYAKAIDKKTLKEYKKYYGVTMGRDKGIVIEREDGESKAIFNSDILSFQAKENGVMVDKLYYDVLAGIYKFHGEVDVQNGLVHVKIAPLGGDPFEITYDGNQIFYIDENGRIQGKSLDIDGDSKFHGEVDVENGLVNVKIAPTGGYPFEILYDGNKIFYVNSQGSGTYKGNVSIGNNSKVQITDYGGAGRIAFEDKLGDMVGYIIANHLTANSFEIAGYFDTRMEISTINGDLSIESSSGDVYIHNTAGDVYLGIKDDPSHINVTTYLSRYTYIDGSPVANEDYVDGAVYGLASTSYVNNEVSDAIAAHVAAYHSGP